jgi:hypothetical protein
MNVVCPKCGFEQPQDRFCANCGIDMDNYRSPNKPVSQRLAASSLFYFFLVLVVLIVTIYFIRQQNGEGFMPAASQVTFGQKLIEEPPPAPPAPSAATPTTSPTAPPTLAPVTAPAEVAAVAPAAPARRRSGVKVTWLEVNKDYFADLFGENLPMGQIRAGILLEEFNGRTLKSRLEQGTKEKLVKTLDSSTDSLSGPTEKFTVPERVHDPRVNEKIGLVLEISRVILDETGLQFHIEIQRAVPTLAGRAYTVDSLNLSDDLLVPAHGAAFISGFFPHREPYDESEQKLFASNSALQIFNSKAFQNGNAELVVLIEATQDN